MDGVERLALEQLNKIGLADLGGAVLRITKPDGETVITRVPSRSLVEYARSDTESDEELASENH